LRGQNNFLGVNCLQPPTVTTSLSPHLQKPFIRTLLKLLSSNSNVFLS